MDNINEIKRDNDLYFKRIEVEYGEQWRKLTYKIPSLKFDSNWDVFILPPYGGAVARFCLEYNGNTASVYLDWYSRLGCVESPYWEVLSGYNDPERFMLNDTDEMMAYITTCLNKELEV